ncbi:MAG: hypothetical protein IT237_12535 [Bacteroidia bacterium]|nr:hypothetical protein [Bacteroidia bacterium]
MFFNGIRCQIYSQSIDSVVSKYIQQLNTIWLNHKNSTFDNLIIDSSAKLINEPFKISDDEKQHNYKNLLLKSNLVQQRIYQKEHGVRFTLAYQENLKAPLVDPEEIVVFKRRAIAGIDWDLLNNGLYEYKQKLKLLKLEHEMLLKKQMRENLEAFQASQTAEIISYFNNKKLLILNKRQDLNIKQSQLIEQLWTIKHITKDNYLKVIQNTTDINAQFNIYKNYNEAGSNQGQLKDAELPILDINIQKLIQYCLLQDSIQNDTLNYATIAKRQSSYFKEMSLKAYTRYSYYDVYNTLLPDRSYVSVGFNLSAPLTLNQKDKREYYILQQQINNFQTPTRTFNSQSFLLNLYYEYQYKLKQFKNLYHKRLVYLELLRTEDVKQKLGDVEFNPNTALFILDDFWSNAIELLDLKQELYKVLINIKSKFPNVNIIDFTQPLNLSNLNIASTNPPFKAIYIWSDAFKNHSQTVITEFCKVNEFNPLVVSYHPTKSYLFQLNEFISKNYTSSIHLMIGSNKLLYRGITNYLDSLKQNISLNQIKGIHLDIEPHTLEGFKEDKEKYFAMYLQILKEAKQFTDANHLELSVSIPLNYPENVLKEINSACHLVYLMAYENIDIEFLNKKLIEELDLLKDKCVLAFRTKDFENRTDMEAMYEKIKITKKAYHDLDELIQFDKQSIQIKNEDDK